MIGIRFIFTVLTVTTLLIISVFLRTDCDRACYEISSARLQADRLKQQLRQKQLLLENYISPPSLIQNGSANKEEQN
jgi:hypothetical protein